jgi:hypothetical protein
VLTEPFLITVALHPFKQFEYVSVALVVVRGEANSAFCADDSKALHSIVIVPMIDFVTSLRWPTLSKCDDVTRPHSAAVGAALAVSLLHACVLVAMADVAPISAIAATAAIAARPSILMSLTCCSLPGGFPAEPELIDRSICGPMNT